MKTLGALWYSLRALFARAQADDEIDEELAFHLERQATMYEQSGMSPADARREAMRHFGGVQRYREECRDVRRVSWATDLGTDIRFALRLARLHPGFSLNVILISSIGIAACVTTFSLVSGILLAPLPFPEPARVVHLQVDAGGERSAAIPGEAYLRLAEGSPYFDGIGLGNPSAVAADQNGEQTRVLVGRVTASYFHVYRIRPALGRVFTPGEAAGGDPVVLLGYEEWRSRYGSDNNVIGRRLVMDGVSNTIIGVMPPRFRGTFQSDRPLWVPLNFGATQSRRTVNPILRLADGVSKEQAEAWLRTILRIKVPGEKGADSVAASPVLVPVTEAIYGDVKQALMILLGAVFLVLLLVVANIATLFLARSAARETEMDVRRALGAGRGREFRQLITESLTLTAAGGAIGLALAYAATRMIRTLGTRVLPRIEEVSLDWRVVLFAVTATILTGAIGGMAHAWSRSWRTTRSVGSTGSRVTAQSTSSALVVIQIALSVILLVGAGLLVKGFIRVAPTEPGFALDNRATIVTALTGVPEYRRLDREQGHRLVGEIADRMRRVPGVRDVAVTSFLPLTGLISTTPIDPVGRPADQHLRALEFTISPNFFDLMEMPLRLGRAFTDADRDGAAPVVVVNQTAAAKWWPGVNPIGRQLGLGTGADRVLATVVGVVQDSRLSATSTRIDAQLFIPIAQTQAVYLSFIAATTVPPLSVTAKLKQAFWSVAPRLPIESSDFATTAFELLSRPRFFLVTMSLFAVAALTLGALGVYGLLAFAVSQQNREIGIRLALGASRSRIGRLVIGRALVIGLVGVSIGGLGAIGVTRYLQSLLYGVPATDRGVFGLASLVVLLFALVAACVPALQAVRVDPIKSIRAA